MITQTKESQSKLTPQSALELLQAGNKRFANGETTVKELPKQVQETVGGQFPYAAILSCIDSRTSSELIFDLGIGDIFNARLAGNVVNEDVLGSLEYSCKVAGSKLVVVLGHSSCGAVTAACKKVELGNVTALLNKIQPAVANIAKNEADVTTPEAVQKVADENVRLAIEEIREKSPILAEMEKNNEIAIVGGMYDISNGKVTFFK